MNPVWGSAPHSTKTATGLTLTLNGFTDNVYITVRKF
jgi:hypothetical protein